MNVISSNRLIEIIASLLILLFLYTATDKILNHDQFQLVMSKSPLIQEISVLLSWTVPVTEILISLLLFIPKTRFTGFITAFALLLVFTLYITYMLIFSSKLPCSC